MPKRRETKKHDPQSSFLDSFTPIFEMTTSTIPTHETDKNVEQYLTFPKIVRNSLFCLDCQSAVILKPDGSMICPKCTTKWKI